LAEMRRVILGPLEPDLDYTSGGKWSRTFGITVDYQWEYTRPLHRGAAFLRALEWVAHKTWLMLTK